MDEFVRKYALKVRKRGGAVNTTLVVAGAKGIVESLDRTRLVEYGGDITFTTSWAKFLLNPSSAAWAEAIIHRSAKDGSVTE